VYADSRLVLDLSSTESRSRRCHSVWHGPRSNRVKRESTGVHFTLKLAESGTTSVGCLRFKSPLAHQYDPRPDLGLYGIRGRSRKPMGARRGHRLSSEALAWHGLNSVGAPMAA
jgi:hypothetical protein